MSPPLLEFENPENCKLFLILQGYHGARFDYRQKIGG